jgi:hypothetical protein
VKPARHLLAPPEGTAIGCALVAFGVVRAQVEHLKALRQGPGVVRGEPLPAAFLKHADEQTVAGLAAVLQAIGQHRLSSEDFTHWGVLAAPRFLARAMLAQALKRFALEGAWGVSPHLIPHRSLHSVSGTVSQALQIHGPNLGVGGGPTGAAKAMLAAAAMVADPHLPGLWVVLTGWNKEPGLEHSGRPSTNGHTAIPTCSAVALALRAEPAGWTGPRLHIAPGAVLENGRAKAVAVAAFTLEGLIDGLTSTTTAPAWRLECGGFVQLDLQASAGERRL